MQSLSLICYDKLYNSCNFTLNIRGSRTFLPRVGGPRDNFVFPEGGGLFFLYFDVNLTNLIFQVEGGSDPVPTSPLDLRMGYATLIFIIHFRSPDVHRRNPGYMLLLCYTYLYYTFQVTGCIPPLSWLFHSYAMLQCYIFIFIIHFRSSNVHHRHPGYAG